MDRDLVEVHRLLAAGERLAVATVVRTWRSAPRPAGATMAVTADGRAIGSISGGCVEGAVYDVAREVLAGAPPRLCRFGVSDDDAFGIGLTCGGTIEVLVEAADRPDWHHLGAALAARAEELPVVVATVVEGGPVGASLLVAEDRTAGSLGSRALDHEVAAHAGALLTGGPAAVARFGDAAVFLRPFVPRPRLLVLGAIDFAGPLVRAARLVGYRVTVCDARAVFATPERFPEADEVVVDWPHRYLARAEVTATTAICVLTHDAKFDVPALQVALAGPAAYVGAMGSRRTHEDRLERLRQAGVSDHQLARLRSPIGLDLGASTAEETAISILAEVIAARHGASGRPLGVLDGPIHRGAFAPVA
ncbi:MAG: XdhC family protein [Acidimicrobiales bacterium]